MTDVSPAQRLQAAAELAASRNLMADAPAGADLNLDDLFPNPDDPTQGASQVPAAAAPQAPPASPEPFLQVPTGTVYSSREEAIRGYEEKDRYIAQLRQQLEAEKGKVAPSQPATPPTPQVDLAESLYDKIAAAAGKGDKRAYIDAQAELIRSTLAPYQGLLAEVARERALRSADSKLPGVREFIGSDNYRQVLERTPVLKQAIDQLEHDPLAAQAQLDQLFELAKLAADGLRVPDLIKAQGQPPPPSAQSQPRPTLQATTPTPSPEAAPTYRTSQEALQSREARKALIESYERRGVNNVRFEDVRL